MVPLCGLISGAKNLAKTCRKTAPQVGKSAGRGLEKICGKTRAGRPGRGGEKAGGRVDEVRVGPAGAKEREGGLEATCFARPLYHDKGAIQVPLRLQAAGSG